MTTYLAKTTFGSFRFSCDLSQAASPIVSLPDMNGDAPLFDEGIIEGFQTPFQCADARHSATKAALLLLTYFGAEFWHDPDDEITQGDDGEPLYAGKPQDEYIRSLLVSVEAEPEAEQDAA